MMTTAACAVCDAPVEVPVGVSGVVTCSQSCNEKLDSPKSKLQRKLKRERRDVAKDLASLGKPIEAVGQADDKKAALSTVESAAASEETAPPETEALEAATPGAQAAPASADDDAEVGPDGTTKRSRLPSKAERAAAFAKTVVHGAPQTSKPSKWLYCPSMSNRVQQVQEVAFMFDHLGYAPVAPCELTHAQVVERLPGFSLVDERGGV